jgi:hypothetical protein
MFCCYFAAPKLYSPVKIPVFMKPSEWISPHSISTAILTQRPPPAATASTTTRSPTPHRRSNFPVHVAAQRFCVPQCTDGLAPMAALMSESSSPVKAMTTASTAGARSREPVVLVCRELTAQAVGAEWHSVALVLFAHERSACLATAEGEQMWPGPTRSTLLQVGVAELVELRRLVQEHTQRALEVALLTPQVQPPMPEMATGVHVDRLPHCGRCTGRLCLIRSSHSSKLVEQRVALRAAASGQSERCSNNSSGKQPQP